MKRILISEEERSRILSMHQEKGYKPLMEQSSPAPAQTQGVYSGGGGIKDQKLMYDGKEVKLPGLNDVNDVKAFVIDRGTEWSDYMGSYLMSNKLISQNDWNKLNKQMQDASKNAQDAYKNAPQYRPDPTTGNIPPTDEKYTYGGSMKANSQLYNLYNTLHIILLNLAYSGVDLKGQQPTKQAIIKLTPDPRTYLKGDGGDANQYFSILPETYKGWLKTLMNSQINTYLKLS